MFARCRRARIISQRPATNPARSSSMIVIPHSQRAQQHNAALQRRNANGLDTNALIKRLPAVRSHHIELFRMLRNLNPKTHWSLTVMMQNQPQCFRQGRADGSKPELSETQHRFAELVGRELSRLWIEQQSGTSHNTDINSPRQQCRQRTRSGNGLS